jgi:nitrite reductase (NADH) large subunit
MCAGSSSDDEMRTSDPDILPSANASSIAAQCYGLVAPLYEMANVVARGSLTIRGPRYGSSPLHQAEGHRHRPLFRWAISPMGGSRGDRPARRLRGIYKRLVLKDDRLIGAVLFGETADGGWFFDLVKERRRCREMRDTLIFGQAFAGGVSADPNGGRCSLPG